jgi:hypothetical protein
VLLGGLASALLQSNTMPSGHQAPIRHSGVVHQTSRGRLALWTLEQGVFVFQIVGHGDRSFVAPVVAGFERSLRLGPSQMFVDVELMTSYDTELRTEVTAALAPDRKRIGCLHILVRSKIVAMGVSVANLALGGLMTIHGSAPPFRQALQAGLTKARTSSFSLDALEQARLRTPG